MAKKRTPPDLSALTRGELEGVVLTLWERLEALESKVAKNSRNSSQPPSTDGLRRTNSLREPSGNKPGAQPGHKGDTLKRMAGPSRIDTHPLPEQCERCSCVLDQDAAEIAERRQVIDTPVVAIDVVEHHVLASRCACGQRHRSAFPASVTQAVQYGPNVRALGVHLTQGQLLLFAHAAQLINDLYGIAISPATLLAWVDEARVALHATADAIAIADSLRAAPLVHADESGLRVQGKLHWLHVAANDSHTWYGVHAKRDMEAIAAQAILPQRIGVLIHDCWAPYWQLPGTHTLCNAHLLRELLYVQEITIERWPARMNELLLRANELREAAQRKNINFGDADKTALRTFYDAILDEDERRHPARLKPTGKAGRVKQSVAFNLLLRLRRYADAVLLFVADPAVPFTNNLGERAIRMPKVEQKISDSFRTLLGAQNFCVIGSCLDTLRKQGHSMLAVLQRPFAGNPIQPALG